MESVSEEMQFKRRRMCADMQELFASKGLQLDFEDDGTSPTTVSRATKSDKLHDVPLELRKKISAVEGPGKIVIDFNEIKFSKADEKQMSEYDLRTEYADKVFDALKTGMSPQGENSLVSRSLFAGKHNSLEITDRRTKPVEKARMKFLDKFVTMRDGHENELKHYFLTALKMSQGDTFLLNRVRVMEIVVHILDTNEGALPNEIRYDLDKLLDPVYVDTILKQLRNPISLTTLCSLCQRRPNIEGVIDRPLVEVVLGVGLNILNLMTDSDLNMLPSRVHHTLYKHIGQVIIDILAGQYVAEQDSCNVSILFYNLSRIFPLLDKYDRFKIFLTAWYRSYLRGALGPLHDVVYQVLARVVRETKPPAYIFDAVLKHFVTSGVLLGTQGCLAILSITRNYLEAEDANVPFVHATLKKLLRDLSSNATDKIHFVVSQVSWSLNNLLFHSIDNMIVDLQESINALEEIYEYLEKQKTNV